RRSRTVLAVPEAPDECPRVRLLQPAGSVEDRWPNGSRLIALLGVVTLCALGLPAHALAQDERGGTTTLADRHVVEPSQAPSIGAVFREVPPDLWRFVSLDTAL